MTDPGQSVAPRVKVEVSQRVDYEVDVTDWIEGGESAEQLQELARNKLEYHEFSICESVECTGWDWSR